MDLSSYSFEALIFDCDGTIADTMPLHYRSWVHALENNSASFTFSKENLMAMAGIGLHDTVRILNDRHGDSLDPEQVAKDKEFFYWQHLEETTLIPEVGDVISHYQGRIPMSVASGSYRNTVLKTLQILNLQEVFDAIITQNDVSNSKPAPDLFLLAASKMRIPPERCLVFEDSDLGVEAARSAGMSWVKIASRL